MSVMELIERAEMQLNDVREATARDLHPDFQRRIQALFTTVNKLTALGHDANERHLAGYDPTCDLCTGRTR